MAVTNFARLMPKQKTVWSRDVWAAARDQMFVTRFSGNDENSMIHRITELTRTEKGDQCLIQLVADLVGDGVIGDNEREGNEEELMAYAQEISIDLISHQVINKGKLADQRTVVKFRETAKNRLAHWLADRCDQLALLTMSGVSYEYNLDGSARVGSPFPDLAFAKDVKAPTSKRHRLWNGTNLVAGDTSAVTSSCVPSYKMIVDAMAYAKSNYIKPLKAGGKEYYVLLVQPNTLAQLKKDPDYQRAVVQMAGKDGAKSPWFTGGTVTIDGAVIHEDRRVFGTQGAASGAKWGSGGLVNGSRSLLCGAQALGMADLGAPEWVEKKFNYDARQGISVDKMLGFLKPQFYSIYNKSVEDFSLLAIDHYQQ